MKQLKKMELKDASILQPNEMKHITGGYDDECREGLCEGACYNLWGDNLGCSWAAHSGGGSDEYCGCDFFGVKW